MCRFELGFCFIYSVYLKIVICVRNDIGVYIYVFLFYGFFRF